MENPIYQIILLISVIFILPLIPSILIYKIFPDTKVGIGGPLFANMKINASGAFAAYLIIALLILYYFVNPALGHIMNSHYQTWTVTSRMKFLDKNGNEIKNNQDLMKRMEINIQPDAFVSKTCELTKFRISSPGKDMSINFSLKDFDSKFYDLNTPKDVTIKEEDRLIDLGVITLKEIGETTKGNLQDTIIKPVSEGPPIKNGN